MFEIKSKPSKTAVVILMIGLFNIIVTYLFNRHLIELDINDDIFGVNGLLFTLYFVVRRIFVPICCISVVILSVLERKIRLILVIAVVLSILSMYIVTTSNGPTVMF